MLDQRIKFILGTLFAVLILGLVGGQMAIKNPMFVGVAVAMGIGGVMMFRGLDVKGLTAFQALFYFLFLMALVITWTPFKTLGYLTPVFFIGGLILGLSTSSDARILLRLLGILFPWATATLLHRAVNPYFVSQNSIISWFTFSSFFLLYLVDSRRIANPKLLERIIRSLSIVVLVQALYGMMQFVYGVAQLGQLTGVVGDFVEGTIHPSLAAGAGADTAIYICNMAPAALALGAAHYQGIRKCLVPLLLSLFAILITDRVHVIAIFAVAVAGAYFWFRPRLSRGSATGRMLVTLLVVLLTATSLVVSQARLLQSSSKMERVRGGRNYKIQLFETVLKTLPRHYPSYLVVGLGPGQFASRASAIAAGYLGVLPRPFEFQMSDPFTAHALPLWRAYFMKPAGSVERPASSWCSLFSEFGAPAFLALLAWLVLLLKRIQKAARSHDDRVTAFFLFAGILFLFGIGAADFYWETCQAVFIAVLLFKVQYANLLYGKEESALLAAAEAKAEPLPASRFTPARLPGGLALAPPVPGRRPAPSTGRSPQPFR